MIATIFGRRGGIDNQSNKLACGGARGCGNTTGSDNAAFLSKWVSILSMTMGSSMQAITLTAPPHLLQTSMSILNTRFRRWAHVIAMDGMYAGFAGAKTGHGCPLLEQTLIL